MGRDVVGSERVQHQQVVRAGRGPGQLQAAVAEHHVRRPGDAVVQVAEEGRVLGKPDDRWVDLVKGPALARSRVAGEASGAQSDQPNAAGAGPRFLGFEEVAGRARGRVVGGREIVEAYVEVLAAVHHLAVEQQVTAIGPVVDDLVDAEEVAGHAQHRLGVQQRRGRDGEDRGQPQAEAERAAAEAETDHGRHGEEERQAQEPDQAQPGQAVAAKDRSIGAEQPGQDQPGQAQGCGQREVQQSRAPIARPSGGQQRHAGRDRQRVLPVPGKHQRCDDGGQQPAADPAKRHPEVELGQPRGGWAVARQPAVKCQGGGAEGRKVEREEQPERPAGPKGERAGQRQNQEGQRPDHPARLQQRARAEHDREAQQVEGERDDPEQRHREDGRRQVAGDRQHPGRGHRSEGHPAGAPEVGDGRRRGGRLGCRRRRSAAASKGEDAGQQGEGGENGVAEAPERRLLVQAQARFDQRRVGEQGAHAAGVAGPVEEVGVGRLPVAGSREPVLEQRAGRGEREEGQADGHGQDGEQPVDQAAGARRRPAGRERDRQHERRRRQHQEVDAELSPEPEASDQVGVGVAEQEDHLEEEDRRRPDGRRPTRQGEEQLGDHRLDQEEQPGRAEDHGGESPQGGRPGSGNGHLERPARRCLDHRPGDSIGPAVESARFTLNSPPGESTPVLSQGCAGCCDRDAYLPASSWLEEPWREWLPGLSSGSAAWPS